MSWGANSLSCLNFGRGCRFLPASASLLFHVGAACTSSQVLRVQGWNGEQHGLRMGIFFFPFEGWGRDSTPLSSNCGSQRFGSLLPEPAEPQTREKEAKHRPSLWGPLQIFPLERLRSPSRCTSDPRTQQTLKPGFEIQLLSIQETSGGVITPRACLLSPLLPSSTSSRAQRALPRGANGHS